MTTDGPKKQHHSALFSGFYAIKVPFLVLSFLRDSCFLSEHICYDQNANEPQVISDEEQVLSPSHLGDTGLDFLTLKKIWHVFRRHHRLRDLLVVAFVGVALQQLQRRGERRRRRFRRFRRRRRFLRIGFDQLVQSFWHLPLRLDRVTQKANLKMLIKSLVEKNIYSIGQNGTLIEDLDD